MNQLITKVQEHIHSLETAELKRQLEINSVAFVDNETREEILEKVFQYLIAGYIELRDKIYNQSSYLSNYLENVETEELTIELQQHGFIEAKKHISICLNLATRYHYSKKLKEKFEYMGLESKYHHSFMEIEKVEEFILEVIINGYLISLKKLFWVIDLAYQERLISLMFLLMDLKQKPYDKRHMNEIQIEIHNAKRRLEGKKTSHFDKETILDELDDSLRKKSDLKNKEVRNKFFENILLYQAETGGIPFENVYSDFFKLAEMKMTDTFKKPLKEMLWPYLRHEKYKKQVLSDFKSLFLHIFINDEDGLMDEDKFELIDSDKYERNYELYYRTRVATLLGLKRRI